MECPVKRITKLYFGDKMKKLNWYSCAILMALVAFNTGPAGAENFDQEELAEAAVTSEAVEAVEIGR